MSFIKTFSGKHFYYDRINKDDIVINDIAVSLSNICRFAGHLSHFYSVAQHAVLCSQLVPQEFAFEALMHDATEAYCQDIPAPLKRLLPDYKRMEEKIDAVIRKKYGLPPVMSTPVKYADLIMLATERRDLGLDDGSFWPVLEGIPATDAKWHLNRSQFGIRIDHDLASISDHSLASQSITIWHASDH